ncbi:MAG TPA: ATP-dependent DNA helicase RecG [Candidatus Saccharimonadales bacterium]|nr:ATP-dependent DNA helicase RecG [Candidatus Saccharimonadales bacterium]
MKLDSPLTDLKGVGPELAKKYAVLGIKTVGELIDYFPRRYEDYSQVTPTSQLRPGLVTIKAVIKQAQGRYVRRGMHITEAVASDEHGSVRLIWFNQPYRAAALKHDQEYYISGNYELSRQRFSIMNPSVELVSEFPVNTARIVPVYRETKGLTSRQIRLVLEQAIGLIRTLPETLPGWLVKDSTLISHAEAVEAIHFPASPEQLQAAEHRLGFEEVFRLSLAALMTKREILSEQAPPVPFEEAIAKEFVGHVPFPLTNAQRKVVWQIYLDMQKATPMNRLVEGDVGSGKTVVAAMAAVMVMHHGHQVAFMAPTELLARQHADTLQKLLTPLGYGDSVGLLVGSMKPAQKKRAHEAITAGKIRLMVGTQALIQEKVDMHSLELIIIDEQHRFGVEQRKTLQAKAGHMPHVLSLTATPIPRSLALTLYGELDIAVLDEKPAGRSPIITKIVSPNSRTQLYEKIDAELNAGRQMFVVCPLISESAALDASSAEKVYEQLSKKDFKHRRVGLLHGRMKADEKNAVMQEFVDGKLDILVSTTVIEVGVDVPNATIMLIENAERFGLAQIHQLRGRVGRGQHQGYCYLMMGDSSAPSRRLRALESSSDGFRLAELDLELRGPGAIYGTLQHGQLDLRIAKLTDTKLIAEARHAAQAFLDKPEDLLQYPELHREIARLQAVTNLN